MENIWFTSDTHFGHANILKYCGRDFSCVNDMNRKLTENWNDLIAPDDLVYHLGDFSFKTDRYINYLNGKIILIQGNHDNNKYNKLFHQVTRGMPLKIKEFNCYLIHRPIVEGDKSKKGYEPDFSLLDKYQYIISGHTHVHEDNIVCGKNINVGVDAWNMKPIHIDELARFLRSLK